MANNLAAFVADVLAALARANDGTASSYGADETTARLTRKLSELFEKDLAVFPVATGTAANSLALATLTPHYGAVICHEGAHIYEDECGAPEFYSSGAKLIPIAGAGGKLSAAAVTNALGRFHQGDVHQARLNCRNGARSFSTSPSRRVTRMTPNSSEAMIPSGELLRFHTRADARLVRDETRDVPALTALSDRPKDDRQEQRPFLVHRVPFDPPRVQRGPGFLP